MTTSLVGGFVGCKAPHPRSGPMPGACSCAGPVRSRWPAPVRRWRCSWPRRGRPWPPRPTTTGAGVRVPVRRQRRLQHGAAHRCRPWQAYTATRTQVTRSLLAPGTAGLPRMLPGAAGRRAGAAPGGGAVRRAQRGAASELWGPLATMFDYTDWRLAVVGQHRPAILPTTKAQYAQASHPRPTRLFSHNDQQNTWQALRPRAPAAAGAAGSATCWPWPMRSPSSPPSRRPATRCGWPAMRCGSTRWAPPATRIGTDANGRLFGSADAGRRWAASSARAAAATCSNRTWPPSRNAPSTPRWRRAPRCGRQRCGLGTARSSAAANPANDPKLQYDNPLTGD